MVLEDLDRVMEIEHQSFTLPWSREAYEAELTKNHFAKYLVATLGDVVVGYAGMWVILDEAHITNIAIDPSVRGRQLGERLMREMMAWSMANGAERMTLEVRVSNLPAQKLYDKLGFQSYGIRKGYYTDNNEDAMIMWAEMPRADAELGME
ncbi:ribosomal-protein-alanine N-acetyltransferase [Tumebacillus algifaecis]|uniref:[Ribosomal protein bS18]-alanine N-acetyltransferase n=2 Tax=Tumebacillus algifaecis TaxID=1214604 RepID=A0A223D6Q3_9BACL|nr:ribosomal protein S18-alanine N-acetyltransferase [Tumebacillus algifaecis]ASS77269.1 ribosomal-protein-alanine N-acetyltransferase [Tumebacillus algifaecis]